ncbi:MAG: DNA topoisomerase III, partial [Clostridiales bacterium]|nr:DNA topoisomerase III [Clostridiales bacterium]
GDISKGKLNKNIFIAEMRKYAEDIVRTIKSSDEKFRHDNMTREKCPQCGKYLLEVKGKKGKMLVCQDRECGYRKKVSQITNARCPNCHKRMELRGEGESSIFLCSCGYREKLSAFKERKSKESNAVSKKEVSKYLKQQEKEDFGNNALAEALAKLKLK